MFVVVPRIPGEDPAEVLFTVDEQVVEALAPKCSPTYRSAKEFALGD